LRESLGPAIIRKKRECWQNPQTFPSFWKKSDKINVDRIRIGVAKYVVATTIFVQNSRREKKTSSKKTTDFLVSETLSERRTEMLALLGRRLFDLGCDEFYKTRRDEIFFSRRELKFNVGKTPKRFLHSGKK
jgi:hypothetical protein